MRIAGRRKHFLRGSIAMGALIAFAQGVPAYAQQQTYSFDIPAQDLGSALRAFARASRQQVTFDDRAVRGKRTSALKGSYTAEQALDILLRGSGLAAQRGRSGLFIVRPVAQGSSEGPQRAPASRPTSTDDRAVEASASDVIVVTGTNIRGIAPESSPVQTYTREEVQQTGAATAQDFIKTVPQNFGGGANPTQPIGLPNGSGSGDSGNLSYGSSVNLRGLGSGSTLVLLNGHRLAPSSLQAGFVDISMIPASAIERVEIMTDGASSVYGADAVAGVVNFILRDDFEGVESSFRYGLGTQHGTPEEVRASITAGHDWNSGHALLSYEFYNQGNLSPSDRRFSRNTTYTAADLQPSAERQSVLATISQDVTSNLTVSAGATFSHRDTERAYDETANGLIVYDVAAENTSLTASAVWEIAENWFFDVSGTYGANHIRQQLSRKHYFAQDPNIAVIDTELLISDAKLSGSLFNLPGGDVKVAFGAQIRTESLLRMFENTGEVARDTDRDVYAVFGELFLPVVGSDNTMPGVHRLELNISGRYDDYSDFGSAFNPKVGVLWSPVEGLKLRGSYSTSFVPPTLEQAAVGIESVNFYNTAYLASRFPGTVPPTLADTVVLRVGGINPDVGPEESRAFTAGIDFEQYWSRNTFTFSTTWFDIDYEGRVGQVPLPGGYRACMPHLLYLTIPGRFRQERSYSILRRSRLPTT